MKNKLIDVFTPTRPARLTFVDRLKVNDRIVRALQMPGMQVVIYGYSGSGKTTLIENKLFEVYEKHIRTNCMKDMTFDQIVLDAFDQLGDFYCEKITDLNKEKIDASIQASYLGIKAAISGSIEKNTGKEFKRILPPQLTTQSLARFMGAAGYCWVLEDFHKVAEEHKESLAQMMKVFMDVSDRYESLKIVAIGAVNTAREVVKFDNEMRRRVSEIHVELMSDEEIKNIIEKGELNLNVKFSSDVISDIIHYSNGLAAICHRLCYILCDIEQIYETLDDNPYEIDDIQPAVEEYLEEESDTIKCSLDKALKAKGSEEVLRIISSNGRDGMTVECIHNKLLHLSPKFKKDKLLIILNELVLEKYGEIVKLDSDSDRYAFSDPFLQSFSRVFFEEKDSRESNLAFTEREMINLLNSAMKAMIEKNKSSGIEIYGGNTKNENNLKNNSEEDSR